MKRTLQEEKTRINELFGSPSIPTEEELKDKLQNFVMLQMRKHGATADELKKMIMSWIDEESGENEPSTVTPKIGDNEYDEQYNKNMSQGFSINEGNAFVGAAKKAKAEGKDSFQLDGKTYKVTVRKIDKK